MRIARAVILVGLGPVLVLLPETVLAQARTAPLPPVRIMRPSTPTVAQREITPPAAISTRAISNSVTLRSGPYSTMIKSLRVIRQVPLAQLRSSPVLMLGNVRVNMAPVLSNPRALFNVAQRIRSQIGRAHV